MCYLSLVHSTTPVPCKKHRTHIATIVDLSNFFSHWLSVLFHILPGVGSSFSLSFVRVTWDGRPQLLTYLFIYLFLSLFIHRQMVFSLAFNFVSYSSKCGFVFFLSFIRVTWDGRPQLLAYLIFFFFLIV